jgi:hypothetical protein
MLFGTPLRLGTAAQTIGHAVVHAEASHVVVAWKERRKPGAAVMLIESSDGGVTFAPAREIAATSGASDHPFLVGTPRGLLLSWSSEVEGHRVVSIANGERQHEPPEALGDGVYSAASTRAGSSRDARRAGM